MRDGAELRQLRDTTITPLADYDDRHDTDLLATLRAFLAHDGSDDGDRGRDEAPPSHGRATVCPGCTRSPGCRRTSPTDAKRLSLGIKAHHILDAQQRLQEAPLSQ